MIKDGDKKNFDTLYSAADNSDMALMECKYKNGGGYVAVICAVSFDGEFYTMVPMAKMFSGNPYDEVEPIRGKDESSVLVGRRKESKSDQQDVARDSAGTESINSGGSEEASQEAT